MGENKKELKKFNYKFIIFAMIFFIFITISIFRFIIGFIDFMKVLFTMSTMMG